MWLDGEELTKFENKIDSISRNLNTTATKLPHWVEKELAIAGNLIRNDIIESMRNTPKTGKAYKRPGGKIHIASSPGNPPAIDYGDLAKAITFEVRPKELEIGAEMSAPHGYWMEKGTHGLCMGGGYVVEPRPWLQPAVEKHLDHIISRIGEVSVEIIGNPFRVVPFKEVLR